ncbi:Uncharacterised protein [Enterobacter asburiae]|uniref:Uncharacterized protein n=1 Tax=Enterobacter asburiae TaxID=61645 RepID=A0A376FA14_ENTAS|nr:Uncharacterised protein [Enterobacter asburiae]
MLHTLTLKRYTPGDCINPASSRDIYFRQDRPGVAIFLECDSVDEAMNVMAEFPLAKSWLIKL